MCSPDGAARDDLGSGDDLDLTALGDLAIVPEALPGSDPAADVGLGGDDDDLDWFSEASEIPCIIAVDGDDEDGSDVFGDWGDVGSREVRAAPGQAHRAGPDPNPGGNVAIDIDSDRDDEGFGHWGVVPAARRPRANTTVRHRTRDRAIVISIPKATVEGPAEGQGGADDRPPVPVPLGPMADPLAGLRRR